MVLKPQAMYFDFIKKKIKSVIKGEFLQNFKDCDLPILLTREKVRK